MADNAHDEAERKMQKKRLIRLQWKRFWIFSLCYFLCNTSFRGLRDLQSTLNSMDGMGLASLTIVKVISAVSGLIVPAVIRLKLGTKRSMVLGTILFVLYTASNYYPSVPLLLSVAVLPGVGDAFLWVSRGTYISTLATELAAAHERNAPADIALLLGIFTSASRMSTVTGNMISSSVFRIMFQASPNYEESHFNRSSVDLGSCGIRACGGSINSSTSAVVQPDQMSRIVLISIYLALGVLAVIIAVVFLERVPAKTARRTNESGEEVSLTTKELFYGVLSAFRLMKHPRMLLLIPTLCCVGVDVSFVAGHFTKFFVGCTQGIQSIGFVMVTFYIVAALISIIIGRLIKYTGRAVVFVVSIVVYFIVLVVMVIWDPETAGLWQLFAMACALAIPRGVMPVVVSTILVVLFPDQKEAAFGNLCFWQSISFAAITAMGVPKSVCAGHVIYTFMAVWVVVLITYVISEVQIKRDRRNQGRIKYVATNSEVEESLDIGPLS